MTVIFTAYYFNALPRTAIDLYQSYFSPTASYHEFSSHILPVYSNFTEEEYRELEQYITAYGSLRPIQINQYALLIYSDGEILLVDTALGDLDSPIKIKSIKKVPEELKGFFTREDGNIR